MVSGEMSAHEACVGSASVGGGGSDTTSEILGCMSRRLQDDTSFVALSLESLAAGLDIFFLIYAASLMFFMQAGFAMVCAGCVREKNVQNTLLKNLLDACGAAIGFFAFGYALAYGGQTERSNTAGTPPGTTFVGSSDFFLIGTQDYAFWVFQFAFAATTATIVAGTLAERCQMVAYLCYSIMLTGFVYPVVAHAVWSNNGFLSPTNVDPFLGVGMIDLAGSGVVHFSGGMTSLIATKVLGPRRDRFHDERGNELAKAKRITGSSVTMQCLGTFILWFGWYGFNAGSILRVSTETYATVAALAAVTTTLGGASGCVSALLASALMSRRRTGELCFELTVAMNGCLSGLVGITAGCGIMEPWAALLVGSLSGLLYVWTSGLLLRFKIDDAVDAIPVHLTNGLWGVVAVGLLASPRYLEAVYGQTEHVGLFYSWGRGRSDATLLGANVVGIIFIFGWVFCIMTPFFLILSYLGWFRTDPLEEIIGLDATYMGGSEDQAAAVGPSHLEVLQEKLRIRSGEDDFRSDQVQPIDVQPSDHQHET